MRSWFGVLLLLGTRAAAPLGAQNEPAPPGDLVLGVSFHDVSGDLGSGAAAEVGYHPDWHLLGIVQPDVGAMLASDGVAYGFVGMRVAVPVAGSVRLASSLGVGVFRGGDRTDLGGVLEFRSGAEVSVPLRGRWVTLSFYHLSNGGLGSHNPGMEVLGLGYTLLR